MADTDDYLQDDFNPRSVTIPRLRSILVTHNIDYPSTAKKTQLVALVEEHVLPQVPRLRAQRDRAKRSSLGIVNAGSAQDNGLWDDDELSPPRRSSRRSRSPRKNSNYIKVEEEEPQPSLLRSAPKRSSRASRSVSLLSSREPEIDAHLHAPRVSSRRSSRRTVTPQIKPEPEPEPEPQIEEEDEDDEDDEEKDTDQESIQYEEEASVFTDDNPFQGCSSSPALQTPYQRRTFSAESSKSKSARRRTPRGFQSNRLSRRFEMETPPDRYETLESELGFDEEFTPNEQLELEDAARSGDLAVVHRQAKAVTHKRNSHFRTPFMVLLMTLVGVYLAWYRQEKMAVGYCGLGRPAKQIIPLEIPLPDALVPFLEPECEQCPQHAYCYQDFTVRCQEDFIMKPHPLALGGLVPLPPSCEPDSEKARRVQAVANKAVEELRDRRAKYECGELANDAVEQENSPAIAEEELKATVSQKRNKRMNSQEFDELWESAIGDITRREEVEVEIQTTTPESPDSVTNSRKLLSSTSLARIPLRCAIKRSIRNGLARYQFPIGLLIMLAVGVVCLRARYRKHRATLAQIPALVDTVLGRLANQRDLGDEELDDPWLFLPNLRDDVLRSEHSLAERDRIWQRVRDVVEQNSNVRTSQRESRSGEVGRAWEWIGPSQGESVRRRRSGRMSLAPSDTDAAYAPEPRQDVQVKKWDEPRPIY